MLLLVALLPKTPRSASPKHGDGTLELINLQKSTVQHHTFIFVTLFNFTLALPPTPPHFRKKNVGQIYFLMEAHTFVRRHCHHEINQSYKHDSEINIFTHYCESKLLSTTTRQCFLQITGEEFQMHKPQSEN